MAAAALTGVDAAAKLIVERLRAQPLVVETVGDRVYPDMIPRDEAGNIPLANLPAIVYQFQSGLKPIFVDGEPVWLDSTWIIKTVGVAGYPANAPAVKGAELAFAPNEAEYLMMDGFYVSVVVGEAIRYSQFDNNVRYYHSGSVYRFVVDHYDD